MAQKECFRKTQYANGTSLGTLQILSLLVIFLEAHGYLRLGVPRSPVTAQPGSDALLRCRFSIGHKTLDLSKLVLTWRFQGYEVAKYDEDDDEEELSCNERALIFVDELRKGNASLLLTNVTTEDSGIYTCSVVYSTHNQVKTLTLEVSGTAVQVFVPYSLIKVQSGSHTLMECRFTIASETVDATKLLVIWTLNGQEVASYDGEINENIIFSSRSNLFYVDVTNGNASLLIKNISLQNSGKYTCTIIYKQERAHKTITLEVFEYAFQVVVPHSAVKTQLGSSALLGCQFSVGYETVNPQKLSVTWLFQGHELVAHIDFYTDEEMTYKQRAHLSREQLVHGNASMLLTDVTLADEGNYTCSVFYWPLKQSEMITLKVNGNSRVSQNTADVITVIPTVVAVLYLL